MYTLLYCWGRWKLAVDVDAGWPGRGCAPRWRAADVWAIYVNFSPRGMRLVGMLAAVWVVHQVQCSVGQGLAPRIGADAGGAMSGAACKLEGVETRGAEDTRILEEIRTMCFYGCVLSIAECGKAILITDPARDILDMYASKFYGGECRAGRIDRDAMIAEIVAGTQFAEVRMQALAAAVYLTNRRKRCVEKLPEIFGVLGRKRYEILVLASSSMGIEWLSKAVLKDMRRRRTKVLCPYTVAKEHLMIRARGRCVLKRLQKSLRDGEQSDTVYSDMRRLILEAVGVWAPKRIVKLQRGMKVLAAKSLSRYLCRDTVWIVELICKLCPEKMDDVCRDHEWSSHELKLVVEGYYPQILRRIPLGTLVAYLAERRDESLGRLGVLPAIAEATRRISEGGCRKYDIADIASQDDLKQIEVLESEEHDALCSFFSSRDSVKAAGSGGLRRWIMMTKGPVTLHLVLSKMVGMRVLAGKTLDMDETKGILRHRRTDLLQLVRDGGTRLSFSQAGAWDIDKKMLRAMEKSSTLGIFEIEHNVATIKVLSSRGMWPMIELLKTQVGPECAAEIDTLIMSMQYETAGDYLMHQFSEQSAKKMRVDEGPLCTAEGAAGHEGAERAESSPAPIEEQEAGEPVWTTWDIVRYEEVESSPAPMEEQEAGESAQTTWDIAGCGDTEWVGRLALREAEEMLLGTET